MKDFFKPEDFSECYKWNDNFSSPISAIAHQANEKLNALIESWPMIYANEISSDHLWWPESDKIGDRKLQARLAFIEEIVKEPCSHKPICTFVSATEKSEKGLVPTKFICDLCEVELQATWSEK